MKKTAAAKANKNEKILLYCMDDARFEMVSVAIKKLHIEVLQADERALGKKVGALFGMRGFSDSSVEVQPAFHREAAVFYNIKNKRLDAVLSGLKEENIILKYKAVTTPFNIHWTLAKLFDTMYKEHAYLVEKGADGVHHDE
ncbi:hypothetical protein TAMA11512_12290 [Selenomonas sp. TAMA-11512]|uniref:DUF3783 domain-containing protein n=1 Tax=Selenomonas sp. TAMA-11512 TaxID=3095337 RepID=UPI00308F53CB|nr:hypothetical protein TAMA11512_12290 [Selenomonas sp. TAMA-11512]